MALILYCKCHFVFKMGVVRKLNNSSQIVRIKSLTIKQKLGGQKNGIN